VKLISIFACAILALALAVSPATAKKKKKKPPFGPVATVTATGNTAPEGQVSTATATCPAGQVAVGGGFSTPPLSNDTRIYVIQSFRSTPNSWVAAGFVGDGAAAVTADAYCRVARRPITEVTATATVSGPTAATAAPTCPAGASVIGGGFSVTRGPSVGAFAVPQSNLSTGPGVWSVTAINNIPVAQTLTAYAYCTTKIKAPVLVSQQVTATLPELGAVTATTPACPVPSVKGKGKKASSTKKRKKKPRKLLSGGGFSSPPGSATSAVPVYAESRIAGGSWRATAQNVNNDPFPLSATSQGVCF
jgi:hypothetical protein